VTERSTLLREMGLTPVWALRSAALAAPEVVAEQTLLTESTPGAVPDAANRDAVIAALSWEALATSIARCTACALSQTRSNAVVGAGDQAASWLVIGDAPDDDEDRHGTPLTAQAGQLLDAMLNAVRKTRTQGAFVTHVVKCHPPHHRKAQPDEIKACAPYLKRQIALVSPKLLVALGEGSAQTLLNCEDTLDALRDVDGHYGGVPVAVTYHPSHLLRAPLDKAQAWSDLLKAQALSA
jgi:uracil-DNA glycosylase